MNSNTIFIKTHKIVQITQSGQSPLEIATDYNLLREKVKKNHHNEI